MPLVDEEYEGCRIATIYCDPNGGNEERIRRALARGVKAGGGPYFLTGDFNTSISTCLQLHAALDTDRWFNLAARSSDEFAPTYGRARGWDKTSPGPAVSQIDYVLGNMAANNAAVSFRLLRHLQAPHHLGLHI